MMRHWPKVNLSSKTRLIAIAVVALLLPKVVLSVVQFRSLVDLEDKTKVAVQENMRQTLQTVSRKVEENLTGLARKNLSDIRLSDLEPSNFLALERRFAAIKAEHPEIDSLFLFSLCMPKDEYYGLFYADGSLRRFDWAIMKDNPNVYAVAKAFNSA